MSVYFDAYKTLHKCRADLSIHWLVYDALSNCVYQCMMNYLAVWSSGNWINILFVLYLLNLIVLILNTTTKTAFNYKLLKCDDVCCVTPTW